MINNEMDIIIREHMDISDTETRVTMLEADDNDKNRILVSLTSKLYDNIVQKVDDIDFGTIPASKGDITTIENYDNLVNCIGIIKDICAEYKQPTDPVDEVILAMDNIKERTRQWQKGYAMNVELPMVIYNTMVLSCVGSISFLITTSIEFIKSGADTFQISLDKVAFSRSEKNLLFSNLKKFNKSCSKGELDAVLNQMMKGNQKNFMGADPLTIVGGVALIGLIMNIVPLLQELTFFFYHTRQNVADYFAVQSDLLQVNAYNIQYKSNLDKNNKKIVYNRQMKIAKAFKNISNVFDIDYKKSEKSARNDIAKEKKQYKTSELVDTKPDSVSSIF